MHSVKNIKIDSSKSCHALEECAQVLRQKLKMPEVKLQHAVEEVRQAVQEILSDRSLQASLANLPSQERALTVALLSSLIGAEISWVTPHWKRVLVRGAFLCDIGQSSSHSQTLRDPDHPTQGVRMLDVLGYGVEGVKQIVLQHHEAMDGKGFPGNLPGKWIYPPARIVGFADALADEHFHGRAWRLEAFDKQVVQTWYGLKGPV